MVSNFVIDEPNILSDHCTVRFSLTARHNLRNINGTDESSKCHSHTYKWDDMKKAEYIDRLGQSHIIDKLQSITDRLSYIETEADLHENVNGFYEIIKEICDPLFKRNIKHSNSNNNKSNLNQPWFDDNCKFKRKEFYENLNFYRIDKSEENRIHMSESRSRYKCAVRSAKFNHDKVKTAKLEKARFQNAKEYWKMLKSLTESHSEKNLPADIFAEYFKAINDPDDVFFQADEDAVLFNERYVKGEFQVMFDELNIVISEVLNS